MNATHKTWTVNSIREAMQAAGSHWWDKSTMKFFGTRVLPTVYQGAGGIYFVTSEQPPHADRAFTVRQYTPGEEVSRSINTIGEVASMTRPAAIKEAKRLAGQAAAEIAEPLEGQDEAPVTCRQLIDSMKHNLAAKIFGGDKWAASHQAGWNYPKDWERPIVSMIQSLADYADTHRGRYESGIGDDGFLGPAWEQMVRSARTLLNGECGRLDCGTLDSLLLAMLKAEGFDEE